MVIQAYHGSRNAPFVDFDMNKVGTGVVGNKTGLLFFTTSLENARFFTDYGGHIALWQVMLENPLIVEGRVPSYVMQHYDILDMRDGHCVGYKYDGIVCLDCYDGDRYSDVVAIWDPEQAIRSRVVLEMDDCGWDKPNTLLPMAFAP